MAFAWFTWERDYRGPTTIDRIRWDDSASSILERR
jgi:hypothetical protein